MRSTASSETELFAVKIGQCLKGGEVIELISDLGGGKTTFVRGLVKGMGSSDHVTSPTFTICRVYHADRLTLHHFDFYRLQEAGHITEELIDILSDKSNVVAIEWAGLVEDVLPEIRLSVTINTTSDDGRELIINYPEELGYLISGLENSK